MPEADAKKREGEMKKFRDELAKAMKGGESSPATSTAAAKKKPQARAAKNNNTVLYAGVVAVAGFLGLLAYQYLKKKD